MGGCGGRVVVFGTFGTFFVKKGVHYVPLTDVLTSDINIHTYQHHLQLWKKIGSPIIKSLVILDKLQNSDFLKTFSKISSYLILPWQD
jgi:hypothetical protein